MLTVRNLTKKFDNLTAVNNISFKLKKGEILGFLGTNGAGKTTAMRLITGFLTPTKGKISIEKKTPKEAPSRTKKTDTCKAKTANNEQYRR